MTDPASAPVHESVDLEHEPQRPDRVVWTVGTAVLVFALAVIASCLAGFVQQSMYSGVGVELPERLAAPLVGLAFAAFVVNLVALVLLWPVWRGHEWGRWAFMALAVLGVLLAINRGSLLDLLARVLGVMAVLLLVVDLTSAWLRAHRAAR